MRLGFGTSAYRRDNAGLPEVEVVNMLAETAPTAKSGVTLISRPGLELSRSMGSGPVTGLFSLEGVFNGDVFGVSGQRLYRETNDVISFGGVGATRFAASATQVLVTSGAEVVAYDGTGVNVAFPDSANVTSLAFLAGYFLAARAGTHRFYWSGVLDGTSWDGLDYASAESSPDELRDIIIVGDEACMLGSATVEFWQPTGLADTPFIRSAARLYRKGVIGTGCAAEMDNTLFWVGPDFIVYRGGQVPERVSDNGIEERVAESSTRRAFVIEWQGHKLFCVALDSGTFAYDASTGQWSRFKSYGRESWRVICATTQDGTPYLGDGDTGSVFSFAGELDEGEPRECYWTALLPIEAGSVPVDNLAAEVNVGRTQIISGEGEAPVVEMRSSRDQGATWTAYRSAPMGRQGEYRTRTVWRRCGLFDGAAGVFGFRVTAPVSSRVSGIKINESQGGRSA